MPQGRVVIVIVAHAKDRVRHIRVPHVVNLNSRCSARVSEGLRWPGIDCAGKACSGSVKQLKSIAGSYITVCDQDVRVVNKRRCITEDLSGYQIARPR